MIQKKATIRKLIIYATKFGIWARRSAINSGFVTPGISGALRSRTSSVSENAYTPSLSALSRSSEYVRFRKRRMAWMVNTGREQDDSAARKQRGEPGGVL